MKLISEIMLFVYQVITLIYYQSAIKNGLNERYIQVLQLIIDLIPIAMFIIIAMK